MSLPNASLAWTTTTPPLRSAALARVAAVQPEAYARTRNHLEGAVTGLSPYLTHGVLTPRDVLQGVLEREPLSVQHKLVYELGWREYFRHVWKHAGDGIFSSLHPGPRPDNDYLPEVPPDIREARSGVRAIDEAVRTLFATGTLHNHARMWLASYVVHVRGIHWRAGADWLVAHLLDGDLASNHLSWQWVAGTGSHKPYLFNAENVARFAPPNWHSPGSPIDRTYEALERIARGLEATSSGEPGAADGIMEPALLPVPPASLGLQAPPSASVQQLRGRQVWLMHPWALRAPPANMAPDCAVVGIFPSEHHAAWPWPEARWQWVDAAMRAVAPECWFTDSDGLSEALDGAALVRTVADPHVDRWLPARVQKDSAPMLFPAVERPCSSFSQWWTRATRDVKQADELS
ncbi:MAG: hypothetical protein RJB26_379 [Pseudomonadota bacterium]|jgi:deoxyribodipyrimidine photo-lyase